MAEMKSASKVENGIEAYYYCQQFSREDSQYREICGGLTVDDDAARMCKLGGIRDMEEQTHKFSMRSCIEVGLSFSLLDRLLSKLSNFCMTLLLTREDMS